MNILITGATGYFGQNLLPLLAQLPAQYHFMTLNRDVNKAIELYPYTNFLHHSVQQMDQAIDSFQPDMAIHLATLSTSRYDDAIIEPIIESNITFGVKLLSALSKINNFKLFVNTGSFAEFRLNDSKYKDAYLYTATKSAFRHFVDFYADLSGFKYITAIPYTVYGGKDTHKKLMDYICESMNATTPVNMTLGAQELDFIHVRDVVAFFKLIVEQFEQVLSLEQGVNFYLGTGKSTSVRQLAALIEQESGCQCNINWGGVAYRPLDVMQAVAPVQNNPNTLGWKAQISLQQGIKYHFESINK